MPKKKKRKWQERSYGLPANHQWTARPGNKVFVADRGKAIFEVPGDWTISPNPDGSGSIRFFDKPKEADADMRLEFSIIYPPLRYPDTGLPIDWSGLPLTKLIEDSALGGDTRGTTNRGQFQHSWRDDIEMAWLEVDFHDPGEDRLAHSRISLSRGPGIYAFITLDFWPEDAHRAHKVWDCVMETLKLGGETLNLDGSKQSPLRRLSMN